MRRRTRARALVSRSVGGRAVPLVHAVEPTEGTEGMPKLLDPHAVHRLLKAYQALLEHVAQPRRSQQLVRRLRTWGTSHFAVESVRAGLATLERHHNAYAALAAQPDPSAADSRARIQQFAASLPSAPSRLRPLWFAAGVLVFARVLFPLLGDHAPVFLGTSESTEGKDLADAAARVADLNLGNISELTDMLLHSSIFTTAYVVLTFGIAAYLVLRPLAGGAISFRTLRHGRSGGRRAVFYEDERRFAERLRLAEREAEVFGAAGLDPPPDPRVDFIVKACLALPFLFVAAANWEDFLSTGLNGSGVLPTADGNDVAFAIRSRDDQLALIAVLLGGLVVLRLTWLALALRQVSLNATNASLSGAFWARRALASLAALAVFLAAFGLGARRDNAAPAAWIETAPLTAAHVRRILSCGSGNGCLPLRVWYACDEPCRVREVRFLQLPKKLIQPLMYGETPKLAPPDKQMPTHWDEVAARRWYMYRNPDEAAPLPTEATLTQRFELSDEQNRWLRAQVNRHALDVGILVIVEDNAYRRTTLFSGLHFPKTA